MLRVAVFVDYSNMYGTLKKLATVEVKDFTAFFLYLLQRMADQMQEAILPKNSVPLVLSRVYWYAVGSIDEWDLEDAKSKEALLKWFDEDKEIKAYFMHEAGKGLASADQSKIHQAAFENFLKLRKEWYSDKHEALISMKKFYHAIRTKSDLIDIKEAGHWKVDLVHRDIEEKRLDTAMAVDMIRLLPSYDIGLLVCGDADSIPSIECLKQQGKHVAVVDICSGFPPERKARELARGVSAACDLVIKIYESELHNKGFKKS